jgi:hypothetical protein
MDIAELRSKLDNIAAALAEQDVQQEDIAIEEQEVEEEAVEEATVEVPVAALAELMQLAGYSNYADKLQEYENEPDEDYSDTEDQLIGLSGGLNGPKNMHTPAAGGDNPMDKEALKTVEESLYKSYKAFLEEAEIAEDSTSMVGYAPKGTTIDPKTGRPVPPKSDGPKVKAEPGTAPPGTKIDPKTGKITVPKGSGPFIKNL